MALTADMILRFNIAYTTSGDLGSTPLFPVIFDSGLSLANGSGASKGSLVYAATRALADGVAETLDVHDGSLVDVFGNALTFDTIRGLWIRNNDNSDGGQLEVGGAAATQFPLFVDNASDKLLLPPDCEIALMVPTAAALDVSTNSDLMIAHDGSGSTAISYDIIILGE